MIEDLHVDIETTYLGLTRDTLFLCLHGDLLSSDYIYLYLGTIAAN